MNTIYKSSYPAKVISSFNNMTGYTDRNKGRISIVDMIVYFD